jgi:S1-C subfamily serine protease
MSTAAPGWDRQHPNPPQGGAGEPDTSAYPTQDAWVGRSAVPEPVTGTAPGWYPISGAYPRYGAGRPGQGYPGQGYPGQGYPAQGYPGYPPPAGWPPQGFPGYPPPPRRTRAIWWVGVVVTLLAVVLGAVGLVAVLGATDLPVGLAPATHAATGPTGGATSTQTLSPGTITDRVAPGLVDIDTVLGYRNARAAGTGMVLESGGLVLTNNHVIADATRITATDVGNGRTYAASVVGYDVADDVAVLQLDRADGLTTVSLGDSAAVQVGDPVVAMGNAGGVGGDPVVVTGSVTALDRSITATDADGGRAEQLTGLIQIAAAIEAGDSGGPLVDASGHVIGMNTAAASGLRFQAAGGVGFAIPINAAMTIVHHIQAGEASTDVHIGPTAFLGVQVTIEGGAGGSAAQTVVQAVVPGSPADDAGVSAGDVLTTLDGHALDTATALPELMAQHHPGDVVSLVWVDQGGDRHTAPLTLATGPAA